MFNQGSGIGDIVVKKSDLIGILAKNAAEHADVYGQACLAYRHKAILELDDLLTGVRSGQIIRLMISMPVPEDHSADYDRAINMLNLHQGDTITLSEDAYMRLVDDEWEWRKAWNGTTLAYTNGEIR